VAIKRLAGVESNGLDRPCVAGNQRVIENPHNSSPLGDDAATETPPAVVSGSPAVGSDTVGLDSVAAGASHAAAAGLPPNDTAPEAVRGEEVEHDEQLDDVPAVEAVEVEERGPIEETPVVDEPPKMNWYILKVQSNREEGIRESLQRRVKVAGLEKYFGEVIVPTEMVSEFKGGKKRVVKRKLYPGYLVAHMEINEDTWFLVRETPGIGDFTGSAGKPTPMLPHEVAKIVAKQEEKTDEAPKLKINFNVSDRVKINEGTFENFEGEVDSIDEASGRVTVMINIFGRSTPVELEYWQIESI
jgi:transcriptional antiterminator NusG